MTKLIMHGYFNDIHFINVARRRHCLTGQPPFRYTDRASIEMLAAGKFRYIVNQKEYVLKAPTLFWNIPYKTYAYKIIPRVARDHFWIDFAGTRSQRIALALEKLAPQNFVEIEDTSGFEEIFNEMIVLFQANNPGYFFRLVIGLERLIGLVHELLYIHKPRRETETIWLELAEKITQRPFDTWDFHAQARKLNMSYAHFRRRFREVLNVAPYEYLLYRQAKRAVQDLQTRNMSVKQLAYEYGFTDPSSLSRLIKNQLGFPAKALRQRVEQIGTSG